MAGRKEGRKEGKGRKDRKRGLVRKERGERECVEDGKGFRDGRKD